MQGFVDDYDVASVPHIPDESGDLWQEFGVRGQPAWVIVPADGSDTELVFGALGEEAFAEYAS